MSERAYTVTELDALRYCCEEKYLYGSYQGGSGGMSRMYMESDKIAAVEQMVRTHMLAGHTAADLLASASTPPADTGG